MKLYLYICVGDVVMSVVEGEAVEMGVEGSSGSGHVGQIIAVYPRLLDAVVCQGHLGTLPVHVDDSEHMVRDVGGGHALAHAIDEEQEITLKGLEHAYIVAFLQLIQICAVVFINTPTILNSRDKDD